MIDGNACPKVICPRITEYNGAAKLRMANTIAYFTQRICLIGFLAAIKRKMQAEMKLAPNIAVKAAMNVGPES